MPPTTPRSQLRYPRTGLRIVSSTLCRSLSPQIYLSIYNSSNQGSHSASSFESLPPILVNVLLVQQELWKQGKRLVD
jgi:hypothetical protein